MNCEICDEEFDTENQLMQHKAQMHAGQGQSGSADSGQDPMVDAREGMMPRPEDEMAREGMGAEDNEENDEELEAPDYPRAANE